jgi:predicted ATPase
MSSFTPRAWKSQSAPEAEHRIETLVEPPQSHDAVKSNNLPSSRNDFIGREKDVAEVQDLLDRHRLVTLVGSGGVGKTRLALQVGTELLDRYPDGVWFVDFAPINDPELVSSVIAQALGMSQQEGRRVDEAIPLWLERKKLLLIFDNCEHVLETVASLADAILKPAQDVRIVATSRQALNIVGEEPLRIPSLDVPAAIALFVSRATTADRSFSLTDDTAPIVADICRRLDGIPLAIELAAARVKVLPVPRLAERLNERFKLLTGGSRSALPRQQTLHALLDWSYDLLTEQEQRLFARLGIFAGGFDLDAATNVCGGEGLDELDILDLVGSLSDKSLVVADTSGEHERYRLLESTAAYALEKLGAAAEDDALARRHAEYFRDQANAAAERSGTGSTFAWLAGVELELDNYRTALAWALTQGNDAALGGAIAGDLSALWSEAGLGVEGRYWIGLALERVSEAEQPQIAARLWSALSMSSSGKRSYDEADRAMQLYATVNYAPGAARAQQKLAWALFNMGRLDEAKPMIEQALAKLRACGDASDVANCLDMQASIEWLRGDIRVARDYYAQALAAHKAIGNEAGIAIVLGNMAEVDFAGGHPEQALRAASEALEIHVRGKNARQIGTDYTNIAAYRIAVGDLPGARDSACAGLRVVRQARHEQLIAIVLQHFAVLAGLGSDARRGAQLLGYVDAQFTSLRLQRGPTEQWGYDKLIAALREKLSADEIATLGAEGATWSEDRAVEEALKV